MRRRFGGAILVFLLVAACLPVLAADQVGVAIMTFQEGRLDSYWTGWNVADGITSLVTDELVGRNKVTVVERTRIEQLLAEQRLGAAELVQAETASRIGKLLGARLMVMGTITVWDVQQTAGVGIGIFRVSGSQAKVELTGRIVDTETGQILGSLKGEGAKVGTAFSMDNFKGVSFQSKQFGGSTLGQASQAAVKQFVDNLVTVVEKANLQVAQAEAQVASSGTVLAILPGDQIVISLGAKHGMTLNTRLSIFHLQVVPGLKDPIRVPVGTARIISVDSEASVAKIESKSQAIQQGDVVAPQ